MKYFELNDFKCHCGECDGFPAEGMNQKLLENLDSLREQWGGPIYISCGYRCPEHNIEVGGVYGSQHTLGNAADIYIEEGDYEEFYRCVINSGLFDGVGHYPCDQFVHVDMRDDGESPNYYLWEG